MNADTIRFEDIDFEVLTPVRVKRHRSLWHHRTKPLVYKFFLTGWEFANQAARGVESGYYTPTLVPNLKGLIVDRLGNNRGYVMSKIPRWRILANVDQSLFSPQTYLAMYQGHISPARLLASSVHKDPIFFTRLLHELIKGAVATGLLFGEISPPNLWVSATGYHLFDLDALRVCAWLFETNKDDPEFIRKVVNRHAINADIQNMIALHRQTYPGPIQPGMDLRLWWQSYLAANNLPADHYIIAPR